MAKESRFLTAAQVSERLQVTQETAREWARSGKVRAITLPNGRYRFPAAEIEAIERGELTPAPALSA
jgi:excisionase family DNA binding protein